MVNKPGKPKSKRTPVRLRHKIEKASAAKQRKQRKQAKSNPEWRSRLKKDPGIPNLFPYKDKILHEIEEKRRLKDEEFARKREESGRNREGIAEVLEVPLSQGKEEDALSDLIDDESMDEADEADSSNPMSALLASARARAVEYGNEPEADEDEEMDEDGSTENGVGKSSPSTLQTSAPKTSNSSLRAYSTVYKNVIQNSDIMLYVLDARDPNGTRSREIEREIASAGDGSKRLILILNKIDLVPPPVLQGWLIHLRRYFPTLPLRASTPAPNAKIYDHKALTMKGTSETLLRALKSYAQSKQLKRSTTVGIIGYPNVGKSSVINALTSRLGSARNSGSAVPVGAEAGVTTALREVKVDGKLKLLDSPGIVFPSSSSIAPAVQPPHLTLKQAQVARLVLLSALPPSAIDDPIPAITLLLYRLQNSAVTVTPLMDYYGIAFDMLVAENGDATTDFLVQVARKRGRLGKGGIPNLTAAAMGVLADWRDGRVRGWSEAPLEAEATSEVSGEGAIPVASKEIVQGWAKEFKLEGLWGDDVPGEAMTEPMQE